MTAALKKGILKIYAERILEKETLEEFVFSKVAGKEPSNLLAN